MRKLPMDELRRIARGCSNSPTGGAIVSGEAELMKAQVLAAAGLITLDRDLPRVAMMTSAGHAAIAALNAALKSEVAR